MLARVAFAGARRNTHAHVTSSQQYHRHHTRNYAATTAKKRATLIPGDGIGPEISDAVKRIFERGENVLCAHHVDTS